MQTETVEYTFDGIITGIERRDRGNGTETIYMVSKVGSSTHGKAEPPIECLQEYFDPRYYDHMKLGTSIRFESGHYGPPKTTFFRYTVPGVDICGDN